MTPSVISHYRIIKSLGMGGMGEVFLAEDTQLERQVAIKCLAPNAVGNEQAEKRLIREAKAAANLDHPNICAVHEVGKEGDRAFIVMQFVEGDTLSWRLRNAPPSIQESIEIVTQVAEALVEAHSRGVVHRDIKPQNLIITPRGQVKVLDFGLAKWTPERAITDTQNNTMSLLTDVGMVVGTVPYMSPEQVRGQHVDARTDLFALGAVLYECVTGKLAFAGSNSMDICAQVIHVDPTLPSSINRQIPPRLDQIISKALAKESSARYQSASEMLEDLRAIPPVTGKVERFPSSTLSALRDTSRLSAAALFGRGRRATTIAVALALVLALILVAWFVNRPAGTHQPTQEAKHWYDVGTGALRDGAYYQASKALERAVSLDSKFMLAHARLAEAYSEIDEFDKAKDALIAATAVAPNRSQLAKTDSNYLSAIEATVRRDFAAAIENYRQIAEQVPDKEKANAYMDLGRSYEKNEELDKATESYRKAIKSDPESAAAHLRLAILLGRRQDFKESTELFNKAEDMYSGMSNLEGRTEVLYQRGTLLSDLMKVQEARGQLEKALELSATTGNNYQRVRTLLQLSSLSWLEAKPDAAKKYATDAIEMAQANNIQSLAATGLIELGAAYFFRDDYNEAETFFKQAADLAQKQRLRRAEARALMALGNLNVTRDRADEAITYIERALSFYEPAGYRKETSRGLRLLGKAKQQKGDYDAALKILEQQLQLASELGDSSEMASSHADIGYLLGFYQEQYPQALTHFDESTALFEKARARFRIGNNYMNRGRLLLRLGRYAEAQSALDQAYAVAKELGDRSSTDLLAWIYLGNAQRALTERRFSDAKTKAQQAASLAEGKFPEASILSKCALGLAQALSGPLQAATTNCEDAVKIAKEIGNPALIAEALLTLAEVMLEKGDGKNAAEFALQAQGSFERSGQQDSEWHAWLIAARASRLAGDEPSTHKYAARASDVLAGLEQKWGTSFYTGYLSRSDIQTCRKQISQILATK